MKPAVSPGIRFIGWVNVVAGLSTPLRILGYAIYGLRFFSWHGAASAIAVMVVVEVILGSLTGYCGWGILRKDSWVPRQTCIVSGVCLGYAGTGLAILLTGSRDLEILIRRAELRLWSLSHFQPPAFVDLIGIVWWVYCLGRICFWPTREHPHPGRALFSGFALAILMMVVGMILRLVQLGFDMSLYSRR